MSRRGGPQVSPSCILVGMKHLLLAVLLLATAPTLAQTTPPAGQEAIQPFKGANEILIHTPDSTGVALKKMARALIVAGIEPDKVDAEIGYITTKGKSVGQMTTATFNYRIVATPEPSGTLLSITGDYTVGLNAVRAMTNPMYWVKGNLLQVKQCFITIEPVAQSYPGGRVGYKLKP
jgi:hypothetical protein